MTVEASKKKEHDPIIIEIMYYDNLDVLLSKIVIPFSEVLGFTNVPDIYDGHEKIPFEKRYPFYQTILRREFADAIKKLESKEK